jgi:hypothetical protein
VDQEYIKMLLEKCLSVNFALSTRDMQSRIQDRDVNFRMNTGYGRYGAAYNMVGFHCFNEELLRV